MSRSVQHAQEALPAIGSRLPPFSFKGVYQDVVTSDSLDGRPAVIALWSSSCVAARMATDALIRLQHEYADRGVQLVVISNDANGGAVRAVLGDSGEVLRVGLAAGRITESFGRPLLLAWRRSVPIPSFLVVDGSGRVTAREVGITSDPARQLASVRAALDHLVARNA